MCLFRLIKSVLLLAVVLIELDFVAYHNCFDIIERAYFCEDILNYHSLSERYFLLIFR